MKKIFYIITFISFSRQVLGQTNLVPNPSFETYSICPNSTYQIQNATGWTSYKNTPDYFNSCAAQFSGIDVPTNIGGYQYAASGNAYAGLYGFYPSTASGKEIIGCQLALPLNIGTKYFVSFKASLCSIDSSLWFNTASNHLGAFFSTVPFSFGSRVPINNFAHVYSNTIITDTLNWTNIFGSFISDSIYKYVAIGNFFDSLNTQTIFFFNEPVHAAYYFIDNVCVSTDSTFASTWTGINEDVNIAKFKVIPNPASDYIFIDNPNESKISDLSLVNTFGQVIFSKSNFNSDKIYLTNISDGLYFIQIISDGKTYYDKIIVRH